VVAGIGACPAATCPPPHPRLGIGVGVSDETYMERALGLAERGRGLVSRTRWWARSWSQGPDRSRGVPRGARPATRGGRGAGEAGAARAVRPCTSRSSPATITAGRRRVRTRSSEPASPAWSPRCAIRIRSSTAEGSRSSVPPASRSRRVSTRRRHPGSTRPSSSMCGPACLRDLEDGRVPRRQGGRARRDLPVGHRGGGQGRRPPPRAAATPSSWVLARPWRTIRR